MAVVSGWRNKISVSVSVSAWMTRWFWFTIISNRRRIVGHSAQCWFTWTSSREGHIDFDLGIDAKPFYGKEGCSPGLVDARSPRGRGSYCDFVLVLKATLFDAVVPGRTQSSHVVSRADDDAFALLFLILLLWCAAGIQHHKQLKNKCGVFSSPCFMRCVSPCNADVVKMSSGLSNMHGYINHDTGKSSKCLLYHDDVPGLMHCSVSVAIARCVGPHFCDCNSALLASFAFTTRWFLLDASCVGPAKGYIK